MIIYLGDFLPGQTVHITFNTEDPTGAPVTLTTGSVQVVKDGATVTPSGGVTLTVDSQQTGRHTVVINTGTDPTTFAAGHDYEVYLAGSSAVSGTSVLGKGVGTFSLANRSVKVDASGDVTLSPAGVDQITIEAGVNLRQSLSAIMAAVAGVLTGAGTGTVRIEGGNVSTNRITATTDSNGNRSAVTLNLP